jgi:hypothetical protein
MGCACQGNKEAGAEWVIKFTDGSTSATYPDESSARIALARSGRTGIVRTKK